MKEELELQQYGLTSYESKVYLTLLEGGIATAHLISKSSGVPYGKIYPVLASLEHKSFVKKFDGKPTRFMAAEPKIILEKFVHNKELEVKELHQQSAKLITQLSKIPIQKSIEPLEKIKVIEGYKNYLNLSARLHDQVKVEWLTISRLPLYQPHIEAYRECIKRGVKVRIITTVTDLNRRNIGEWKKTGAEIREVAELPGRFSVMDDTDVIIRISGEGKYLALWIRSQSLAKSSTNYFHFLWQQAKQL